MVDGEELRRWAIRLAAPLAFFLGATILVLVVQRGLDGGESATTVPTNPAPTATPTETAATTAEGQGRRRYRVRQGDTLGSIAERFDTTVERLQELNPGLDPLALTPGQRIRVR